MIFYLHSSKHSQRPTTAIRTYLGRIWPKKKIMHEKSGLQFWKEIVQAKSGPNQLTINLKWIKIYPYMNRIKVIIRWLTWTFLLVRNQTTKDHRRLINKTKSRMCFNKRNKISCLITHLVLAMIIMSFRIHKWLWITIANMQIERAIWVSFWV